MTKRIVFLVAALAASLAVAPPAARAADQPSPNVKAALDEIQRSPSPQAFRAKLKQLRLTKAEGQELDGLLKKPPYDAAFLALKARAEAERFGPSSPPPVPRIADLEGLRRMVAQEHATRLAALQAQAQSGLEAHAVAAAAPRRLNPALASRMAALSGVRAPSNPSAVELTGTDPDPAVTGVVLVIFGRNLGRQGDVTIIVGAEDPRPENAFDCRIMGWGAEAIHVTVPAEIEDLHRERPFPNGVRSALVWVRPQGDASGRWRQITVKLNPDHFEPVIESAPSELTPGLRFAIRGRNLAAGAPPRVVLTQSLTGRQGDLRVLGYGPDWIDALVPENFAGMRSGVAGLWVSNRLKESRHHTVRFAAVDEVLTFVSQELHAWSYSIFDAIYTVPGFQTSGIFGVELRDTPFRQITHSGITATRLANDWTVAGVVTSESGRDGHGAGCYLEHAAAAGGTEFAATTLVGWANSYCGITCQATLTIRGPRGVPIR